MKKTIYLDHHASTPIDPKVLERMLPFFSEHFGNPSSQDHAFGWAAADAVEEARAQVASLISCSPEEIIFTSGATESSNLAWLGLLQSDAKKRHLITTQVEHSAILETARFLQSQGYEITYLPVDEHGKISLPELKSAIRPDTLLVSVQAANNEVGTLQALGEIGSLCKEKAVLFHTDAAQAGALLPLHVQEMGIDLLSLSSHKMYGPKGVGALYVRKNRPRVQLHGILHGGNQERGIRPGTLNVPGIVGFGYACELAKFEMKDEQNRLKLLTEALWISLKQVFPELKRNGHLTDRLANNLHVSFIGFESEQIISSLRTIAVSTGAACDSHKREPSHVLRAMGLSPDFIHSSIRFGLGRFTTPTEISETVNRFREVIQQCEKRNQWARI